MRKVLFHTAVAMSAVAFVFGATASAFAGDGQAHYDGYCYAKKDDSAGKDALKGAAIGAAAGAIFGHKKKKVKTAVIGAAVGAAAGYVVGKNSHEKINCADGRYYVYSGDYYDPAPADQGYRVVFFEDRPGDVDLYVKTSGGQDAPYNGN